MDTRLLQDALVLLEEKNLSKAAARRNMTQPAFSRRIRSLEDWLGQQLIVRHANKVDISPNLVASEQQIRALVEQMSRFRDQMRSQQSNRQELIFASQQSLSVSVFPEIYKRLQSEERPLFARLRSRNQDEGISMFLRHEVDILLTYEAQELPSIPFDETVKRSVWRRDALIPVAGGRLRHQLTDRTTAAPNAPVITYPKDSQFGQLVEIYQRQASLKLEGKQVIESAFSVGIARMVLSGTGAGWVPHSLLHDEVLAGDAIILSPDYGRIPLNITLHAHRTNQQAVEALSRLVE